MLDCLSLYKSLFMSISISISLCICLYISFYSALYISLDIALTYTQFKANLLSHSSKLNSDQTKDRSYSINLYLFICNSPVIHR